MKRKYVDVKNYYYSCLRVFLRKVYNELINSSFFDEYNLNINEYQIPYLVSLVKNENLKLSQINSQNIKDIVLRNRNNPFFIVFNFLTNKFIDLYFLK